MTQAQTIHTDRRLTTPRAAAIAGILFSVLYITTQVLLRLALPDTADSGVVLAEKSGTISLALSLIPLAGIAFLWFIGVVRDRLGEHEDRFFATVFFGSGLLYLGLTFIAGSMAGGLLGSYAANPQIVNDPLFSFSNSIMHQTTNIYGLRMASVFMSSLATILLRTGVLPRWIARLTYILSLILLITISLNVWIKLLFPAWVFVFSLSILIGEYRSKHRASTKLADLT